MGRKKDRKATALHRLSNHSHSPDSSSPKRRCLELDADNQMDAWSEQGDDWNSNEQLSLTSAIHKSDYCVYEEEDTSAAVVVIQGLCALSIRGVTCITSLCGMVDIHGFLLTEATHPVVAYSPNGFTPLTISAGMRPKNLRDNNSSDTSRSRRKMALQKLKDKLQEISPDGWEALHSRVQSSLKPLKSDFALLLFSPHKPSFYGLISSTASLGFVCQAARDSRQVSRETDLKAVNVQLNDLASMSILSIRLPELQKEIIDGCLNSFDNKERVVLMVCGGKNVGKSTFVRFFVNHFLNRTSSVAYLECDVGQTEFTPSGLVSLSLVDKPLLGPPFTHQRKPISQCYFGNLSPADDPLHYMSCVEFVFKKFHSLSPHSETLPPPLIVNTMGWNKGLGLLLFIDTLRLVRPTHMVQFDCWKPTNNFPHMSVEAVSNMDGLVYSSDWQIEHQNSRSYPEETNSLYGNAEPQVTARAIDQDSENLHAIAAKSRLDPNAVPFVPESSAISNALKSKPEILAPEDNFSEPHNSTPIQFTNKSSGNTSDSTVSSGPKTAEILGQNVFEISATPPVTLHNGASEAAVKRQWELGRTDADDWRCGLLPPTAGLVDKTSDVSGDGDSETVERTDISDSGFSHGAPGDPQRLYVDSENDGSFRQSHLEEHSVNGDGIGGCPEETQNEALSYKHFLMEVPADISDSSRPSAPGQRLIAADHRNLSLLANLSGLFDQSNSKISKSNCPLAELVPYRLKMNRVAVHVTNAKVPRYQLLHALNGSILGLCRVPENQLLKDKEDCTLPMFLKETPVCECLGLGILRGIDLENRLFYLLATVAKEKLSSVNCLLKGALEIPHDLIISQTTPAHIPYVDIPRQGQGSTPTRSRKYMQHTGRKQTTGK